MREPDKSSEVRDRLSGKHWAAWRVQYRPRATLGAWLLYCPGVHAAWSYWLLGLVHLRPVEGAPEAKKQYPDAEYELLSAALSPDCDPDPDSPKGLHWLSPLDFAHQFHGVTDAQAIDMLERFVDLVMGGRLAPDTDYSRRWRAFIDGTVEHLTTGHPVGHA
jgi:hypothetical protein